MRKLLEAARALVEQCEKCHFVDLLGDKLEMNQGYYDFRAAIAEEEAKMTEPTAKAADTSSRGEASPSVGSVSNTAHGEPEPWAWAVVGPGLRDEDGDSCDGLMFWDECEARRVAADHWRGREYSVVCLCPRDSTQPAPAAEETRLADRKVIELAIQCRQGRGNLNDLAKACDVLLTLRTQAGKKTP